MRRIGFERQIAKLVNDQEPWLGKLREPLLELSLGIYHRQPAHLGLHHLGQRRPDVVLRTAADRPVRGHFAHRDFAGQTIPRAQRDANCLLYTSDAAD